MDSGENNFTDAFLRDPCHFPDDLAGSSAPDPPPCIRNNTVGAELIAAILDFDKGPCVAGRLQLHVLVFGPVRQVGHGPASQSALREPVGFLLRRFIIPDLRKKFVEKFRDPGLIVVADRKINGFVRAHAVGVRLHIASHSDHYSPGISLFGLVDHLAALSVGDVGDRAGVDHVYVRFLFKRDGNIPVFLHFLPHYVQFVIIYFASEVVKCYTFQSFSSLFFSPYDIDFSHARIYY